MSVFIAALVLFFSIAGVSDAEDYCICNDGLSDAIYQKNIDYACGAGADCAPIMRNGPCFQPITVKDHCNFAVNSLLQKAMDRPNQKLIIHLSLSIKITVATSLVVMVIGLLMLFQRLNEGESHQEAANHGNGQEKIKIDMEGSLSTTQNIEA
ncbi:Hypothetical predicted protein [Olea europaea subsp. europaea]|uniref:X8 domain-containing protein n=1 Tax=Olea europaea subsp. europaea TaxID=158383 RepID=A0A8S0U6K7_OLEEU|nr:Hypothetical predicted protein [Olea europaea subsp. europaea]